MNEPPCALDTSVALRLLTRDPAPLFKAAAAFLSEQVDQGTPLAVCDLVVAEAYFALQHHYGFPKAEALAALRDFAGHPGIEMSPITREILTLPNLATAKPGFVDRLIHGASHAAGQTLVSFEKATRKLPATLVLSG